MARKWLVALVLVVGACTDDPPACITIDPSCAPLYPPTFNNVYANTLSVSCGSTNSSCHASESTASTLSFADEDTAYSELLDKSHFDADRYRVVAGDPSCSVMIVRTNSPGASYQMPIGTPLSASEQCALVQWVQAGAPGPGQGSSQ